MHLDDIGVTNHARLLVDAEFCLNLRGHTASCHACAKACPADALDISEFEVALDAALCTSCGACLPVCPTGAFRLGGFSPERLLAQISGAGQAHVHCVASPGDGVRVPCHLVLDARLIAAAKAEGVQTFHLHGLSECDRCDRGNAIAHLAEVGAQLRDWFGVEDAPLRLAAAPAEGSSASDAVRDPGPRMSRRDWFRMLGAQAAEAGSAWLAPAARKERSAPALDDLERSRPAEYQAVIAERAARLPWRDAVLPWRGRSALGHCTVCLACARRCPTGALGAVEDADRRALSFDPALCTDCGLCDRLCPEEALVAQAIPATEEPRRNLMSRGRARCPACGRDHFPPDTATRHCPACADQEALLASWLAQQTPEALSSPEARGGHAGVPWRALGRERRPTPSGRIGPGSR